MALIKIPERREAKTKKRTSRHAAASLTFGMVALPTILLLVGFAPAVAAVVCGHLGLSRIRENEKTAGGKSLAFIGLAMGYFSLAILPFYLVGLSVAWQQFYPRFENVLHHPDHAKSIASAQTLYEACERYATDHKGRYPATWEDLEKGSYLKISELEQLLTSPHAPESQTPAFKLIRHDRPVLAAVASEVVVISEVAPAFVDKIVVVNADGSWELKANPNQP